MTTLSCKGKHVLRWRCFRNKVFTLRISDADISLQGFYAAQTNELFKMKNVSENKIKKSYWKNRPLIAMKERLM